MRSPSPPTLSTSTACYHCGASCPSPPIQQEEKSFCCEGCKRVYEIIHSHDLGEYYLLENTAPGSTYTHSRSHSLDWLNAPEVRQQLIDYADENQTHITFRLPQIHCSSCVWLLEQLYKLHPGIYDAQVNFLRRTLRVRFDERQLPLGELAHLLSVIGYPPEILLEDLQAHAPKASHPQRLLSFQLGVAGFCFGNIMLLSFPEYLNAGQLTEAFSGFFSYLTLLLVLPVLLFSARDYYQSAFWSIKQGRLNMDVPITLGILTLFGRSLWEIMVLGAPGYLDALAGLVFFLLIGKWFQVKTYQRLSFDKSYTAYFPATITRKTGEDSQRVPITQLEVGDIMIVKEGEIIPADGILLSTDTQIDYSFVTGESVPVPRSKKDSVYAGGRIMGKSAEILVHQQVNTSYLTQLWEQDEPADKPAADSSLADRVAQRFTWGVLTISAIAGIWWAFYADLGTAANVVTSVLIVACPCGLALSAPIALGNTLRILARRGLYVKNIHVLEAISQITHIVFDKTGTLTQTNQSTVSYQGTELTPTYRSWLQALTQHSTHPVSKQIHQWLGETPKVDATFWNSQVGKGITAQIEGHQLHLGSWAFLSKQFSIDTPKPEAEKGTYWALDGTIQGVFQLSPHYRTGWVQLVHQLARRYGLSVLSGDHAQALPTLQQKFPAESTLLFEQSPFDKRNYLQELQQTGEKVMMVGDGLNDAGALKQSEVGIAVAEDLHQFSPACDAILSASHFSLLAPAIQYAHRSLALVKWGYALSLLYNVVGLSIAVQGLLSPLIAAILMPLSSISVVAFSLFSTWFATHTVGLPLVTDKSHFED